MTGRRITGPPPQGVDEAIAYQVECTPPATAVIGVTVYDETDAGADVTATVMPAGTASISGGNITLPLLQDLTAEHLYRVEAQYSDGTSILEPYFLVKAYR